ncbi:MAG: FecR family protein [Chitinophagaceae bacterium]|nr:FecR family protein [Chitinophagaceae bacterium]
MDVQNERLNYLLQRYLDKTLTESEFTELSELLRHNWKHIGHNHQQQVITREPDWEQMVESILNTKTPARVRRLHFSGNAWFKYAAAIVIIAGAALYLTRNQNPPHNATAAVKPVTGADDVLPGSDKAILTLADGTIVALDNTENGTIAKQGNSNIVKKDGQVIYNLQSSGSKAGATTVSYNTMTSPRGGQYKLILPDGSKVWLNAASSIRFPTEFTEDRRIVTITGEVYFEVAKNPRQPFIVKTYAEDITVVGTSFNVNSYPDEPIIKTSLLEGSVWINGNVLQPGQAYMNGKITSTNLEQDLAWKNGFFSFNKTDLPAVMRQLSRWYNVEVKYEGAIPKRAFSGEIGRNLTLRQVLDVLSQTRIHYKIEQGNLITIMP